jgi:putative mRNA 3-end processing factor
MKLQFQGAAQEVGRSCILVEDRFLLDAGIMLEHSGVEYPLPFNHKDIDAIFLSHAHLDHSGALPFFVHEGMNKKIFVTKMGKDLASMLLRDSLKVQQLQGEHALYTKYDIDHTLDLMNTVRYETEQTFDDVTYVFYPSGHIPGSASVQLTINGQTLLYTGDICFRDSRLLSKASFEAQDVDIVITEGTYGDRSHQSRQKEEQRFVRTIKKSLAEGGSVLIPSFAIGRAQEVAMILAKEDFGVPIYLDGMARAVAGVFLKGPKFIRDPSAFQNMCKQVKFVRSLNMRRKIAKEQGIFVSPSGMANGGPVFEYLKFLHAGKHNALLFTGYQDPEGNGYKLLNGKPVVVDDHETKWAGHVEKFNFSAHAGQDELVSFIQDLKPKHVVVQHGDPEVLMIFRDVLEANTDAQIHIPQLGEVLTLS